MMPSRLTPMKDSTSQALLIRSSMKLEPHGHADEDQGADHHGAADDAVRANG